MVPFETIPFSFDNDIMKAEVVIGACFGDEGKGIVTDFLCSQSKGSLLCVRFNGGAQAGHTVVGSTRHVFHHFGSGFLAGADTFLSEHFIVNPFLWEKEWLELRDKWKHDDPTPDLVIDPRARLTTPYDMLVNQFAEHYRTQRHGSCGIGINETVTRCEQVGLATFASSPVSSVYYLLPALRNYAIKRLWKLTDDNPPPDQFLRLLESEPLVESYLVCLGKMQDVACWRMAPTLDQYDNIVFEGAQGLLLDEDHRFFPHVTRSHTGLRNVIDVASDIGIDKLSVRYVMRTYMTRHGAGPFPTEDKEMKFHDDTNVDNEWQGGLRFGTLDLDLIIEAIQKDLKIGTKGIAIIPSIAVTHMDQLEFPVAEIELVCGLPVELVVHGPNRNDVLSLQDE